MLQLPGLGAGFAVCMGILVLVIIILVIAFFLKMLIEFLPATILAVLIYLFTNDIFWSVVAFLIVAFILSFANRTKRVR